MSYVVRSVRETGTITYHCRSTGSALEKLQDFQRAEYTDITVTGIDDRVVSEGHLISLLAREAVEPIGS